MRINPNSPNLSASMNEANSIFLDGTHFWDIEDFSKAKEVYNSAASKYREVDYRAKEMFNRTQNVDIYMSHVEKAKEYVNKAWDYFGESQKLQ